MSYIETPAQFPYPWYLRLMFRRQRRRYGHALEPVRLWARMPAAFLAMSAMYRALDRRSSPIEPALRSLIQVRISQINGCEFCVDLNSFLGLGRGNTENKLRALPQFEDSPLFSEREKAALAYAEAITWRLDTDDRFWSRLHKHFTESELVELGCFIALTMGQQSWLRLLDIEHHQVLAGTAASMAPGFENAEALTQAKAAPDYWAKQDAAPARKKSASPATRT